jgi:hypothetical protein
MRGLAGVAQSVEQLIRNEKVGCSIHLSGTNENKKPDGLRHQAFLLPPHL